MIPATRRPGRAAAARPAVSERPLRATDLMTCPAPTLAYGLPLDHAARALRSTTFTVIAVIDKDGYLVSLVTEDSVAKAYLANLRTESATTEPSCGFTLPPRAVELNAPLSEIIEVMLGSGLHALPVVHRGRPVGVLSWHDILSYTAQSGVPPEKPTAGAALG